MPEGAARPERRRRPRLRAGAETRDNAFLNVPYDRRYERLYLAFIAGLSAFGLAPARLSSWPGAGDDWSASSVCYAMTPASPIEVVAAKIAPLFVLLMGMTGLALTVARLVFHVPFRGSLALLLFACACW